MATGFYLHRVSFVSVSHCAFRMKGKNKPTTQKNEV
uniref:Uncharacterized protein n=1 Tax=Anguilla anguilla TaxID=7936 RepID=A0A0E9RGF6_ANGAN